MKVNGKIAWSCCLAALCAAVYGETYKMNGADGPGTSSFNTVGKWVLNSNTSVAATEPPRAAEESCFTVPLMLLAPGVTLTSAELAALPIKTGLSSGWIAQAKQETVTVGGVSRVAVSAEIKFGGTTIIIR